MGRHDQLKQPLLPGRQQSTGIVLKDGLERLCRFPLRMLRRQTVDAIEGKLDLGVVGLLHPERSVIVEHGDPLGHGHELRPAVGRDGCNEIENSRLAGTFVPGWQRVGGGMADMEQA